MNFCHYMVLHNFLWVTDSQLETLSSIVTTLYAFSLIAPAPHVKDLDTENLIEFFCTFRKQLGNMTCV